GVPWVAVADLLLSSLCREVGHEVYELPASERDLLLAELRAEPRLGPGRVRELAEFLRGYAAPRLKSADPDERDFARAQRLLAVAELEPAQAVRELAAAFRAWDKLAPGERTRLAVLAQAVSDPLPEAARFRAYARGL